MHKRINTRYENAFKTSGVTKQQLDQTKLALTNAGANSNKPTSM
jgi:hypothetical protein